MKKIFSVLIAALLLSACGKNDPNDIFSKQINEIPKAYLPEDGLYEYGFELTDYEIIQAESLTYPYECKFRFSVSINNLEFQSSSTSSFESLLRYNSNEDEWELSELQRTDENHDLSQNEKFNIVTKATERASLVATEVEEYNEKLEELTAKIMTKVKEQAEGIQNTTYREEGMLQRLQSMTEELQGMMAKELVAGDYVSKDGGVLWSETVDMINQLIELRAQKAKLQTEVDDFVSRASDSMESIEQINALKKMNSLLLFKFSFEDVLTSFMSKSGFKKIYEINLEDGSIKRN